MAPLWLCCCAWLLGAVWPAPVPPQSRDIVLWFITAKPEGAVARGVRMGAEEMARTTSLLGRRFDLRELPGTQRDRETALERVPRVREATFILIDLDDPDACAAAERLGRSAAAIVLNARVPSESCSSPMLSLRLPPSRRDAILAKVAGHGEPVRIDEWHSSLQRFGAQELNERYERRTHAAMDGDAWAGWFAAKVAAEASLRLDRPTREALRTTNAPVFDGHKGAPLRFNGSGVLDQPVYAIAGAPGSVGTVLKEIP